jgi:hypothetical protein
VEPESEPQESHLFALAELEPDLDPDLKNKKEYKNNKIIIKIKNESPFAAFYIKKT